MIEVMNRLGKRLIGLFAVLTALLPFAGANLAMAAGLPFSDISRSYAKDEIVRLHGLRLVSGTGGGRFEPDNKVTRAELVSMLDRLFGIEPVKSAVPAFADVRKSDWHYPWIQSAVELGLAKGVSHSRFDPGRGVTREEAAVLIARAAKQPLDDSPKDMPAYSDQDDVNPSALPAVLRLRQLGIMQGDAYGFRPNSPVTREEAAVFMDRILQRKEWTGQIRSKPRMKIQLGWQYGQTTEQYQEQVKRSNVNTLSPRWYFLDPDGISVKGFDASLVDWAGRNDRQIWAMAGNRSDRAMTSTMLQDEERRKRFVSRIVHEVKTHGLEGLNLDFENVGPRDRDAFTLLVQELAEGLHAGNAVLSVDLSPNTYSDWTDAYDYAAIGHFADYVVLMGYEEHWGGGPEAGPVASLTWVGKGLNDLLREVPADKVILAIPLYTRLWKGDDGNVQSEDWSLPAQNKMVDMKKLKPVWDDRPAQYTVAYRVENRLHRLWLEDGRSLVAKTMLGERAGVAGYAYWYMGGESPEIWTSLRNAMRFSAYDFSRPVTGRSAASR